MLGGLNQCDPKTVSSFLSEKIKKILLLIATLFPFFVDFKILKLFELPQIFFRSIGSVSLVQPFWRLLVTIKQTPEHTSKVYTERGRRVRVSFKKIYKWQYYCVNVWGVLGGLMEVKPGMETSIFYSLYSVWYILSVLLVGLVILHPSNHLFCQYFCFNCILWCFIRIL